MRKSEGVLQGENGIPQSTETLRQRREIVTAQWREKTPLRRQSIDKVSKNEAFIRNDGVYVISAFCRAKRLRLR